MAEMTACEWLLSEREADIVDLPLQFNGFCGCTFVCRDGLLLPGTVPPLILGCYRCEDFGSLDIPQLVTLTLTLVSQILTSTAIPRPSDTPLMM